RSRRIGNGRILLRGTGLTYKYGRSSPFQLGPLDISVREGDVLTLMGPNGAGKTTLCKLLAGVYEPAGGELVATRRSIDALTRLPPMRRRHQWGASVYYSFQNPDHQLYQPTIRKELQEAARRIQGPRLNEALFDKVVATMGLGDKLDAGPWDLTR